MEVNLLPNDFRGRLGGAGEGGGDVTAVLTLQERKGRRKKEDESVAGMKNGVNAAAVKT